MFGSARHRQLCGSPTGTAEDRAKPLSVVRDAQADVVSVAEVYKAQPWIDVKASRAADVLKRAETVLLLVSASNVVRHTKRVCDRQCMVQSH